MTNYQVPINLDHYCKRVPALEQNHFSSAIRKYIFIFLHWNGAVMIFRNKWKIFHLKKKKSRNQIKQNMTLSSVIHHQLTREAFIRHSTECHCCYTWLSSASLPFVCGGEKVQEGYRQKEKVREAAAGQIISLSLTVAVFLCFHPFPFFLSLFPSRPLSLWVLFAPETRQFSLIALMVSHLD